MSIKGGHRFFLKELNGWFIDPVLSYSTHFSGWGHIVAPEVRVGKVINFISKRSSVYFLMPMLNFYSSNVSTDPTQTQERITGYWSTGVGAEWGYLPYMSFVGSLHAGTLGGQLRLGVEFHQTNYYSA
jgi:hypothetical protein